MSDSTGENAVEFMVSKKQHMCVHVEEEKRIVSERNRCEGEIRCAEVRRGRGEMRGDQGGERDELTKERQHRLTAVEELLRRNTTVSEQDNVFKPNQHKTKVTQ